MKSSLHKQNNTHTSENLPLKTEQPSTQRNTCHTHSQHNTHSDQPDNTHSNPSACNPSTCNPSASNPSACNTSASNASACNTSASSPSACNPSTCNPSTCNPSTSNPSASNPLCTTYNNTLPISAIFFDFDGTLAVPTLDFALMRKRVYQTLACYGAPQSLKTPALEGIAEVCANLDPTTAQKAHTQAMQSIVLTEIDAAKQSALFPFVRPMLAELKKNNIRVSIVTRNCKEAVCTVFPDIFDHVAHLVTRHDVRNVKPHPEHLEKALELLQCHAQHALMVGDHPTDIIVGQRVGTRTAGVASGEATWEDLAKENPTYMAKHVGELMEMLIFK